MALHRSQALAARPRAKRETSLPSVWALVGGAFLQAVGEMDRCVLEYATREKRSCCHRLNNVQSREKPQHTQGDALYSTD